MNTSITVLDDRTETQADKLLPSWLSESHGYSDDTAKEHDLSSKEHLFQVDRFSTVVSPSFTFYLPKDSSLHWIDFFFQETILLLRQTV